MQLKLPAPVEGAFLHRPLSERFIAAALCSSLATIPGKHEGKTALDDLIGSFGPADIDWSTSVRGHQLWWYQGKNKAQLKGLGYSHADIEKVAAEFAARGQTFPDDGVVPKPDESMEITRAANQQIVQAQLDQEKANLDERARQAAKDAPPESPVDSEPPADDAPPAPPEGEQTFAGRPLSEYAGKTRKQLLAMDINPNTADRILSALKVE